MTTPEPVQADVTHAYGVGRVVPTWNLTRYLPWCECGSEGEFFGYQTATT
jgi:hypothetical protein